MNTQHTKEPWGFSHRNSADQDIGHIDQANESHGSIATTWGNKHDARRIVACVNACAGISTESLEAKDDTEDIFDIALKACQQRDELLTELKEVKDYATSRGYFFPKSAGAAIAKAEGAGISRLMSTVTVSLDDLNALGALICDRDNRDKPPTLENIDQSHALIIKMMGDHAGKFYATDDSIAEALA